MARCTTKALIVIFCALVFQECDCLKLSVGAFFHEDDTQAETALRYAVMAHNMFNNALKFEIIARKVSESDTFSTSKIVCDLISANKGVAAIFGPPSRKTGAMIKSICNNFDIPYLQTSWNLDRLHSQQTTLSFFPDNDLLSTGIATLVKHMNWNSYAILYEDDDSLAKLKEVLKIASSADEPVIIRQLGDGPDYRPLLKQILMSQTSHIILDCPKEKILDVLQQAKGINLLDFFHSYLLTNLDAHTLDFSKLDTRANITMIRLVNPDDDRLQKSVRDWTEGESARRVKFSPNNVSTETALMYDAANFFTSNVKELYATDDLKTTPINCALGVNVHRMKYETGFRISNYLKIKYQEQAVTGPIKFDDKGRRIIFHMEIIELNNGQINKTAVWNPFNKGTLNFTRSASQQMQAIVENLQKTLVIVSSRIGEPYLRDVKRKDGEILEGNSRYEGFSKDLIYEISKVLNFTFRIHITEDGKYGNYDETKKSWNGLIKDLLERKAHLAICDLTITHQRRSAVDFSMPFMTLGVSILYSKGKKQADNKFAFLDPFGVEVWMYIATLYLTISMLLYIIARMAPGDWENPHPCDRSPDELENIWDLKNCLWITLGSVMTQGCDILPKGISTRMGVSMWWFFSLIITSSYTANLAAFLTKDKMGPTIDSAEALSKQTKIKYGLVDGGSTSSFFKDSNFSTYARMWTNMLQSKPSVFEKNNNDGVKRILNAKNQGYAFLMESSSLEYEVAKNCELKQVGGRLDSKGYGIAMPINSPYRSAIDKAVLQLQEGGTLRELKKRWWKEKVEVEVPCSDEPVTSGNELALANVGGVFILLGLGILVAFFLAFLEFLWNVRRVAIAEHIGYIEAFVIECKFAIKVWITQKLVKPDISESTASSRAVSESTRVMKETGSFMDLDIIDRERRSNNKAK